MAVLAFWLALVVVGVLSLMPVEDLPAQAMNVWDKAQHAAGFLGLCMLGLQAHPKKRVTVLCALLAYGVAIELAQAATGWRTGDFADWLADACGVGLGAAAHGLWSFRSVDAK